MLKSVYMVKGLALESFPLLLLMIELSSWGAVVTYSTELLENVLGVQ